MADTIPVIWGQTSDGKDAYVKTCTAGVYNPETGKTLDKEMATCIPESGENLPPTPIDADTLQGHAADYFVAQEVLDAQRTYSTTEQWTGEYYTGKDGVARKVYSRIVYDNAPSGSSHKIDLGVKIVDIVGFDCFSKIDYGNGQFYTIPVPYSLSTTQVAISYIDDATQSVNSRLHYGAEGYKPVETRWLLKYTKQEAT